MKLADITASMMNLITVSDTIMGFGSMMLLKWCLELVSIAVLFSVVLFVAIER